jgi:hypothetical protein
MSESGLPGHSSILCGMGGYVCRMCMARRAIEEARPDPADWAKLLLARDDVQGRATLERMIEWYEQNDSKAWDSGELFIVKDARAVLELADKLRPA